MLRPPRPRTACAHIDGTSSAYELFLFVYYETALAAPVAVDVQQLVVGAASFHVGGKFYQYSADLKQCIAGERVVVAINPDLKRHASPF